jgi:hypothetical protein
MPPNPAGHGSHHHAVVTPTTVVIPLTGDQQKQAQACIAKSGHVKFTIKEITVTNLPETHAHNVVMD